MVRQIRKYLKAPIYSKRKGFSSRQSANPLEVGPLEISVKIPKLCYEKTYSINVTDVDIPSVAEYEIFGDDKVKSLEVMNM